MEAIGSTPNGSNGNGSSHATALEIIDADPSKASLPAPKPKHPGGRPTLYRPQYCRLILKWFEQQKGKGSHLRGFPTFEGFAYSIGVNAQRLHEWRGRHAEFQEAYTRARDLQKHRLISLAVQGKCPPNWAIFLAKNMTDMREQPTTVVTTTVPITVNPFGSGRGLIGAPDRLGITENGHYQPNQ